MSAHILLADDHQMVRLGLRSLLEADTGLLVIGEAATSQEAIDLTTALRPDVLITDIAMPGLSALAMIRQVRQLAPELQVVIFSMHAEEHIVREALRAGAIAYVLKESDAQELLTALRHAIAGKRYLCNALSQRAIDAYARPGDEIFDPYDTLTEREREVLAMAAAGNTSAEIAGQLKISARTVDSHRMSLMRKLGLRSLADLVRYAVRRGIVLLEG